MKNPALVLPEAMQALHALHQATLNHGIPESTLHLVYLRASQVNGCGFCVDMHARDAKQQGETDERLWGIAAWRESPHFTASERAALALTEAATRISDRPDAVPDALWREVTEQYDEQQLAALLLAIGSINVWNRLNVATQQIARPLAR